MTTLCRVLQVHRSGFYAWMNKSESQRDKVNLHLSGLIKQCWLESGGVYGYRKIHDDLRDLGETCGINRVYRLMKAEGLRSQTGYRRRYRSPGGQSPIVDNQLKQAFDVSAPNQVWVTDITYIRTYEGWLYLAVVIDLFSRQVIGWSMKSRMQDELVLDALLMAIWRRHPTDKVMIHSDQGTQYRSRDWQSFLKAHNVEASMSRRGNCYDNAVAESFFQLLKRERIKRQVYRTREDARRDIFEYIELFYNSTRKHGYNGLLSPQQFEKEYQVRH